MPRLDAPSGHVGQQVQCFGAGHGLAGNVGPLLKGSALLDVERRQALVARCARAFVRVASVDADAANWRGGTDMPRTGKVDLLLERLRLQHGQGRHTLWTGDAGLAVFLWQCIEARAGMPLLDFVQ